MADADLVRQLEDLKRQLRELPPSIADSFLPVVADLQQTIEDTIAATYYTKVQTDARIASPGAISPTSVAASGPVSGSSLSASGTVTAGGGVSATGDVSATGAHRGADIYATNAPTFNITGTRVAAWWESATGRGGTASSSERFKTNIADAGLIQKAELILDIQWVYFNYKAEIARRDDPTSPEYVGPSYIVHTELGAIAERLHEAGLWEFVVYERDPLTETRYRDVEETVVDDEGVEHVIVTSEPYEVSLGDTLRLNANGEPIPFGIHYELLSMAAIAAAQYLYQLHQEQKERVDKLAERLAALDGLSE